MHDAEEFLEVVKFKDIIIASFSEQGVVRAEPLGRS
jgi:hypothetical protein